MLVVKLMGGMGNQMFQYSFARSLAEQHDLPFHMDLNFLLDRTPRDNFVFRDYDLGMFNIKESIVHLNGGNSFTKIKEKHFHYDSAITEQIASATKEDIFHLEGYWQTPKYFEQHADLIRRELSYREELLPESQDLAHRIGNSNSVCLNVRRADFVHNPLAAEYHGFCGLEYITRAVSIIQDHVAAPNFFVFSDDVKWCEENIELQFPTEFVPHQHAGKKFGNYLELMRRCKHFVIPNSTFGWWAAWLSENQHGENQHGENQHGENQQSENPNKVVVAPKQWFLDDAVNTSDLIPDTWIRT